MNVSSSKKMFNKICFSQLLVQTAGVCLNSLCTNFLRMTHPLLVGFRQGMTLYGPKKWFLLVQSVHIIAVEKCVCNVSHVSHVTQHSTISSRLTVLMVQSKLRFFVTLLSVYPSQFAIRNGELKPLV